MRESILDFGNKRDLSSFIRGNYSGVIAKLSKYLKELAKYTIYYMIRNTHVVLDNITRININSSIDLEAL
jgi:hypothetical protein